MPTRLYIGNLSYQTTDQDLRELFSGAGEVASAVVIIDRASNRSKGFGFVEMATEEGANKAMDMFNEYSFHNRKIRVDMAKPREGGEGGGGGGGRDRRRPPRPRRE